MGMLMELILDDGYAATSAALERGAEPVYLGLSTQPLQIAYLPHGMSSGEPAIALMYELDGKLLMGIISARLLVKAGEAVAEKARIESGETLPTKRCAAKGQIHD